MQLSATLMKEIINRLGQIVRNPLNCFQIGQIGAADRLGTAKMRQQCAFACRANVDVSLFERDESTLDLDNDAGVIGS